MILELESLCFVELRQRGSRNIEAHMTRGRDFIDFLPAGTLSTHRMDVDLCIQDLNVRQDVQHRDLSLTSPPAARPLETRAHSPKFESDPNSSATRFLSSVNNAHGDACSHRFHHARYKPVEGQDCRNRQHGIPP